VAFRDIIRAPITAVKPYYITTAIDYTNAAPHIGHAYEKVLADVMARFQRLNGREVYFLTGVDQHGQKVQKSAEKAGQSPQDFVDGITQHFTALWDKLNVRYDGWAATTDIKHKRVVQAMLQKLHDCGQLYKKSYGGFYSVRQEQFLTDKERGPDGQYGEEWGEVVELQEENWYFRLSDHVEWLKNHIRGNPDFIFPPHRANDVLNSLEGAAQDSVHQPSHRTPELGHSPALRRKIRELRLVRRAGELRQLRRLSGR
jgi:methionyl-tRNA synthetase